MSKSIDEILDGYVLHLTGRVWSDRENEVTELDEEGVKDQLYQLMCEVIGMQDGTASLCRNELRAEQLTALNKVFGRDS